MPRPTRQSKKDPKPVLTEKSLNSIQGEEMASRPKRTVKPTLKLIESNEQLSLAKKSVKSQNSKMKREETKKSASLMITSNDNRPSSKTKVEEAKKSAPSKTKNDNPTSSKGKEEKDKKKSILKKTNNDKPSSSKTKGEETKKSISSKKITNSKTIGSSKAKGDGKKKNSSSKEAQVARPPSRVPIYRQEIATDDESEATDIYTLKKSETESPKRPRRRRPAQKAVKKLPQPKKEKVAKERPESITVAQEALPAFSVDLCPESDNVNDYFDEPNLDLVMEEAGPIQLETEVSSTKRSTLPECSSLHKYKTPSIPSRVASRVRDECKVSTPRLDGVDEEKLKTKEVISAGSYQAPPLAQMRAKCFGFDDYDSEDSAEISQGSIGAGSLSLSEISPVKRSSLLPPNQCLTLVGTPSIIGMSTSVNFSEKSQLHAKPSRFVHPSKKSRTNRSAFMSTKRKNVTSSSHPIPENSNKENLKKSKKVAEKVTVLKETPQTLVQPVPEPVVDMVEDEPKKPLRPRTKQSLIYETVNQKKVFKTLKRGQPKAQSTTFLDELPGVVDEKESSSENQDALPEALMTYEPPSKSAKTYLKKEEPAKISKKAATILNDWESQQSLHFSKIDEFDLIFEKD